MRKKSQKIMTSNPIFRGKRSRKLSTNPSSRPNSANNSLLKVGGLRAQSPARAISRAGRLSRFNIRATFIRKAKNVAPIFRGRRAAITQRSLVPASA